MNDTASESVEEKAASTKAPETCTATAKEKDSPEGVLSVSQIDIKDFMNVELRIAEVVEAVSIPKSKKLLKLQVSLGDYGSRQILAGLAQHYSPDDLIGKRIVVVANLKPAKLMGEESQGMLLAASPEDNSTIVLLQPAGDIAPGSRVR